MPNHKDELKDYMLKEIEIIQDMIKRMAFNSFLINGWSGDLSGRDAAVKRRQVSGFHGVHSFTRPCVRWP